MSFNARGFPVVKETNKKKLSEYSLYLISVRRVETELRSDLIPCLIFPPFFLRERRKICDDVRVPDMERRAVIGMDSFVKH